MTSSADFAVLFAGDSITGGMPDASYFDIVTDCLAASPAWAGAHPVNAGRGGDTVEALLHRAPRLLERHHPRWAVLAIGHNDIWFPFLREQDLLMDLILNGRARALHQVPAPNLEDFEADYRALMGAIQEHVGDRLIICTCNVVGEDLSSPTNRAMSQVNDLIRDLAMEGKLALADVWAAFVRELAGQPECSAEPHAPDGWQYIRDHLRSTLTDPQETSAHRGFHLTMDGIHPNAKGAKLWAQAVYGALSSAARRLGV